MKTIVFHSYKGGVGRSLALANLALALSELGKNVVALDLDIDAPGLHSKFALRSSSMEDWEYRVKGGYVDYLAYYFGNSPRAAASDRDPIVDHIPEKATTEARRDYLNECFVVNVSENLKFIPAGKSDQKYWWNLASPWFNELFSISRNEYSPNGTVRLHRKRDFLKDEKNVVEKLFPRNTDYFLVDCKSAREYSSVPLYYWANVIISMFPANDEGIHGAARVHQFIRSVRKEDTAPVKIIPVACRVPGDFDYSAVRERYDECLSRYLSQYFLDSQNLPGSTNQDDIFLRLRENRLLEHAENLLVDGNHSSVGDEWYHALKLDYVELYSHIFDETDEATYGGKKFSLNSRTDWMDALRMAAHRSVDDGHIQIKPDHGIVENKDSQRNVLLRASTLRILVGNMAHAMADDSTRHAALIGVGRNIGSSFGVEFAASEKFFNAATPFLKKLEIWCDYDSQNAGFGILTPAFDVAAGEITIQWSDNFMEEHDTNHLMDPKYGFWLAQGYIEGVLGILMETAPKKDRKVTKRLEFVRAKESPMTFIFRFENK